MTHTTFKTLLTIPLLAGVTSAQNPKSQGLLVALGANAKQVVRFQWKQKTTILRNGSPSGVKIDEIRFDASGQPQRITIVEPPEKHMGPLRARKAAEVKEDVQEVMHLAGRYAHPEQLAAAIKRGEIWEGPSALRVHARDVLQPADDLTLYVNSSALLCTRIEIRAMHEGAPISIAIDYLQLSGGPSMMSRMTVQIPKDRIAINVESYDFQRLGGPSGF